MLKLKALLPFIKEEGALTLLTSLVISKKPDCKSYSKKNLTLLDTGNFTPKPAAKLKLKNNY